MNRLNSICVFCGSQAGAKQIYSDKAAEMGQLIADRNLTLVYGGGSVGLMGILAKAAADRGAEVISVIPESLLPKEVAGESIGELVVCQTMLERKSIMADKSDGFIAMPGGYGTLDEIFEMVTWTQLGIQNKPLGFLNVEGFYDPLLATIDHTVTQGFIRATHRDLIVDAPNPEELLSKIENQSLPKSTIVWKSKADHHAGTHP